MCPTGHPSSGQVPPHQSDKYCDCTVRSVEEILATGQAEPGQESDLPDSFNQRSRDSEWKAFLEAPVSSNHFLAFEQQNKQTSTCMTSIRNGTPRPTLESTTPAVCSPEATVELEPSGVSGGGREIRKSNY